MVSASFTEVFLRLEAMGLTDLLLPFLLIFAIVFAVLQKVNIFGKKKNINAVVAIIIGLLVVIPHITGNYPPGADAVEIINNSIPAVSVFIVGVVMLLILIGVFGVNVNIAGSPIGGVVALISFLIVGVIFANSAGWFDRVNLPPWLNFLGDPDTQALLLVLLVFGIIVWFVTSEPGEGRDWGGGVKSMFGALGEALKKE